MTHLKKIVLSVLLMGVLVFSLAACGNADSSVEDGVKDITPGTEALQGTDVEETSEKAEPPGNDVCPRTRITARS